MTDLAANIFSNVWSLTLIILFFGGSIFVHELGHFLAARRRGLRVERFSIGFGPKIVAWKRDGVEYRISWIPLGGYVALPQLADMRGVEGEGSEELEVLPPISYASKMIVSVMGAVFNLLFAIGLSFIIWQFGLPTPDSQTTTQIGYVTETLTLKDETEVTSPARYAGLQEGDTITAIDGKEVDDWGSLLQTLVSGAGRDEYGQPMSVLTIERNGESMLIKIYPRVSGEDSVRKIGITSAEPLIIGKTGETSPAALAGLKPGDNLTAVDGQHLYSQYQMRAYFEANPGRKIRFTFERDGKTIERFIQPVEATTTKDGEKRLLIGAYFTDPWTVIHPTPWEQIKETSLIMFQVLSSLVNPKSDLGIQHMSGPPGIARYLWKSAQVDIRYVIWFTIIINVNLAIFNLLPIPVLDGGHILFATIGKLAGRPLPPNFVAAAQSTFMILLFSLLVFVSFNDIGRCNRDNQNEHDYRTNTIEPVFEKPETTSTNE